MQSDSGALLRMVIFTSSESLRLGYTEAAAHLEMAAQALGSEMKKSPKSILSDDVYRLVEDMVRAKRDRQNFNT